MKEIEKYTSEELNVSLISLHKEMEKMKQIINSLDRIAKNSSSVLDYQSSFSDDIIAISNSFKDFTVAFPEIVTKQVKETFTNSNDELIKQTSTFLNGVNSNVSRINDALHSFATINNSIEEIVQLINNFNLDDLIKNEITSSLSILNDELKVNLNNTLNSFNGKVNETIDNWDKIDSSLQQVCNDIKRQTETLDQVNQSLTVQANNTQNLQDSINELNLNGKFQKIQSDTTQFTQLINVILEKNMLLAKDNAGLKNNLLVALRGNKQIKIGVGILVIIGIAMLTLQIISQL
jgi:methyl-accepting chemotaxis protein